MASGTTNAPDVDLRTDHDPAAASIGQLAKGEAVTVIRASTDKAWLMVSAIVKDETRVGWIEAKFADTDAITPPTDKPGDKPEGKPEEKPEDKPKGKPTGPTDSATAIARIVAACEREWDAHKDDCSGFVRAVGRQLGVTITGLANQIVDEIQQAPWQPLANGAAAKAAADNGALVIGGLKAQEHGHVVVVVSGPLDGTHHLYPHAYWGRLNSIGKKNETINFAWRAGDRDNVIYASRPI